MALFTNNSLIELIQKRRNTSISVHTVCTVDFQATSNFFQKRLCVSYKETESVQVNFNTACINQHSHQIETFTTLDTCSHFAQIQIGSESVYCIFCCNKRERQSQLLFTDLL
jgi:hypothetical protein